MIQMHKNVCLWCSWYTVGWFSISPRKSGLECFIEKTNWIAQNFDLWNERSHCSNEPNGSTRKACQHNVPWAELVFFVSPCSTAWKESCEDYEDWDSFFFQNSSRHSQQSSNARIPAGQTVGVFLSSREALNWNLMYGRVPLRGKH